ncbi:MAG: hypothetical protein ACPF9K_00050 [Neptuniibacter sp.]
MNKKLIIGGVVALVVVLILGAAGVFGYLTYSKLSEYQRLGNITELQALSKENSELTKKNAENTEKVNELGKQFAIYRQKTVDTAIKRAERKIEITEASFTPLSGAYVIAAAATQEQLENCLNIQELIQFEMKYFETADASLMMQQEKVCGTVIEAKILPLFKYQMLRVRASLTGSLGHLRPEAEQKFKDAQELLKRWDVPVNPELDKYIRF